MLEKDKKRITIIDLLQAHEDGLTIQEIIDKTGLARHTVLARLHHLEGEGKIWMRQVNMAKMYYWKKKSKINLEEPHDQPHEQLKKKVKVLPLQGKHITFRSRAGKNAKPDLEEPFDLAKIKSEIEKELHTGDLTKHQADLKKQRMPITNILNTAKHKKERRVGEYLQTGIPGFDELFEQGIPKGNSIIVAGGAGSGKTIFCLQTLYHHALNGENCLYMSFEESEPRLIRHMEDFGWDPLPLIKKGKFMIKRFNPFDITRSVDALLMKAKGELLIDVEPIIFPENFKPSIIVVDSLTAIASAFTGKEDSYRIYIEQLFRFFENIGATSFLITETEQIPKIFSTSGVEEFLADGVIVLYAIKRGNIRENAIEVLKMRGEKHQKKIVALQINDNGITVYPEQEVFGGVED